MIRSPLGEHDGMHVGGAEGNRPVNGGGERRWAAPRRGGAPVGGGNDARGRAVRLSIEGPPPPAHRRKAALGCCGEVGRRGPVREVREPTRVVAGPWRTCPSAGRRGVA